jgi:hypothetical protein
MFVVPHGASSANVLGLTQQVPIREVYLTSGHTRRLKHGRSEVLVKYAPRWMLALGARWFGSGRRTSANRWRCYAVLFPVPNGRRWPRRARRCPAGWRQAIGEEAARG